MPRIGRVKVLVALVGLLIPRPLAAQTGAAVAPPASAMTAEAQLEFLRTAKVIRSRAIGKGVTVPMRLTLSDGAVEHDAAFQSVNERRSQADFGPRGVEFNFVDSHHFNLAAYVIAGMLGLDAMMPPTLHRVWNGKEGTLTWWVDGAFDEATRVRERRQPPNQALFNQQTHKMRVFAALVGDSDRHLGNVLITPDWQLRMIDFTRAFRLWDELKQPGDLQQIDRTLLLRLRELDAAIVKTATEHCLSAYEQAALMKRRDRLVAHFDALIRAKGPGAVLYGAEPAPRPR